MIDPASGALIVDPKFDLEITKAMRRSLYRIKFGVYRELLLLYFSQLRLELLLARLRIVHYLRQTFT